jgi:CBS domain-containing protein
MPMLLGTKGNDILKWRASAELVTLLKDRLARKWEQSPAESAQSFLEQFIASLGEELGYETQLTTAIDALDADIEDAAAPEEIPPLTARYLELVSAHFRRRRSVLALCGLCGALHDRIIARALAFAGERTLQSGQGGVPGFALLVCGDRGRGEQTLRGENRYFLLHEEQTPRFLLFHRHLSAALQETGLPGWDGTLWHGNLKDWRELLAGSFGQDAPPAPQEDFLAALPPFAAPRKVEPQALPSGEWNPLLLADLVFLQGKATLATEALAGAARTLQGERFRDPFLQLARRIVALPVALGLFGRWRVEREGAHKGELNLNEFALDPLVMTLRVLALHLGIESGGSVERIHLLLEKGALDVELAGKLLKAYQVIMQLKILIEIRGDHGESYCHPEEFSPETEARFRAALDAVLSLQKIAYQRLVGQV